MSRKKVHIARRAARVGGAFHHLTSTSFSGQVTSLLNLVCPPRRAPLSLSSGKDHRVRGAGVLAPSSPAR